ncbi:YiiX/YebB-like N1pC/P60 family cysteine hydrolase [Prevotella falsenii]|uniref:YiiX/YebB-like N1pC/P60 family cysteine hydrolase n=1 Tax=Prevotella falsenii TaxID=515414 RepID=UPI000469A01D|nr:YiiX/YebB-like N1pC/P60 family cysteine hydrolase [Prevotella falsenii]
MKYKLFAVLAATVFLFTSCYRQHEKKLLAAYIDTMSLRNGDLIFREGRSVESTFITTLDSSNYSHVGLLCKHDGAWKVVHAVPGESDNNVDTVKIEPINAYLHPDRCAKAKVFRVSCEPYVAQKAVQYALKKVGVPFDDDFNTADTTKFYCTELVWKAYFHAGIDISEGRKHNINVFSFHKPCLLPSDIMMGNTIINTKPE